MTVCYNKLWKLLIDKGINKIQFCKEAKNEDVRVEVLAKICVVLNCRMDDIMDIFSTENNSK